MAGSLDLNETIDAVRAGRVVWRLHVLRRMVERGITREQVREALEVGEIIEEYPTDQPYPSALVLGSPDHGPLHVVIAFDEGAREAHVITTYEPGPEKFEADLRTRRRP